MDNPRSFNIEGRQVLKKNIALLYRELLCHFNTLQKKYKLFFHKIQDRTKPHLDKLYSSPHYQKFQQLPKGQRWLIGILILVLSLILIRFIFIKLNGAKIPHVNPIPVQIAKVNRANVPIFITALGSVLATETVTVRTQINGQLIQVLFKEGQTVKKGDLLAEIDPRPYEAQLIQFQGQLARDEALLANANLDLERYQVLYIQDSVSQQTLDTQKSLVKQLEGTIKFDLGQIELVKVNLMYTKIVSPIDGRVGLRLVDQGNFVQTTDVNGIVVINTVQPITVVFSIPEDNLQQVLEKMKTLRPEEKLMVEAYDRSQNKLLGTGHLLSMDNQIDPSTGTIKLKGQFTNEDNYLFPNQFVNIRLVIDTIMNTTVIPIAAIQQGIKGPFVFILNEDNTVQMLPISIQAKNGELAAITGLSTEQHVIVEGADKLSNGSKVTFSTENKP